MIKNQTHWPNIFQNLHPNHKKILKIVHITTKISLETQQNIEKAALFVIDYHRQIS